MPRYFFNTADGASEDDELGAELPNLTAARLEAIQLLGAILSTEPTLMDDGHDFVVEVTDEHRMVLLTFTVLESGSPAISGHRGA